MRCSNKDYTYAILRGKKDKPSVIECQTINFPKGYSRAQCLKWMLQEIEDLLNKNKILRIAIKSFEGRSRGKTFEIRVEHEAAIYIASANCGIKKVSKKVKGTIAKDLGLKGRAKYLETTLDTSLIDNYDKLNDKEKDAILAGWSELY